MCVKLDTIKKFLKLKGNIIETEFIYDLIICNTFLKFKMPFCKPHTGYHFYYYHNGMLEKNCDQNVFILEVAFTSSNIP